MDLDVEGHAAQNFGLNGRVGQHDEQYSLMQGLNEKYAELHFASVARKTACVEGMFELSYLHKEKEFSTKKKEASTRRLKEVQSVQEKKALASKDTRRTSWQRK